MLEKFYRSLSGQKFLYLSNFFQKKIKIRKKLKIQTKKLINVIKKIFKKIVVWGEKEKRAKNVALR